MNDLNYYYNQLSDDFHGVGDFEMLKLAAYERRTDVLERIADILHSIDYTGLPIAGMAGHPISVSAEVSVESLPAEE